MRLVPLRAARSDSSTESAALEAAGAGAAPEAATGASSSSGCSVPDCSSPLDSLSLIVPSLLHMSAAGSAAHGLLVEKREGICAGLAKLIAVCTNFAQVGEGLEGLQKVTDG